MHPGVLVKRRCGAVGEYRVACRFVRSRPVTTDAMLRGNVAESVQIRRDSGTFGLSAAAPQSEPYNLYRGTRHRVRSDTHGQSFTSSQSSCAHPDGRLGSARFSLSAASSEAISPSRPPADPAC